MEADAVDADAEAELGRVDALEAFHIAFAGTEETCQGVEDAERGGLIDGAELGLGAVVPDDPLAHPLLPRAVRFQGGSSHAVEVFQGKAVLGEDLLMGDAFATGEGGVSGFDVASFFFCDRLIVVGRVGESAGKGIEHRLQQPDDSGDLAGGHAVDEFVGLFPGMCVGHLGVLFLGLPFGPATGFVLQNHALEDGLDDVLFLAGEAGHGLELELEVVVGAALVPGEK